MKKVLFYGRIFKENENIVATFLKELLKNLLINNYQIITREGTSVPNEYDSIWLDNMVLDIACSLRDSMNLPYESVMSFIMDDDRHESLHDRVKMYLSSNNRLLVIKKCWITVMLLLVWVGRREYIGSDFLRLGLKNYLYLLH